MEIMKIIIGNSRISGTVHIFYITLETLQKVLRHLNQWHSVGKAFDKFGSLDWLFFVFFVLLMCKQNNCFWMQSNVKLCDLARKHLSSIRDLLFLPTAKPSCTPNFLFIKSIVSDIHLHILVQDEFKMK